MTSIFQAWPCFLLGIHCATVGMLLMHQLSKDVNDSLRSFRCSEALKIWLKFLVYFNSSRIKKKNLSNLSFKILEYKGLMAKYYLYNMIYIICITRYKAEELYIRRKPLEDWIQAFTPWDELELSSLLSERGFSC